MIRLVLALLLCGSFYYTSAQKVASPVLEDARPEKAGLSSKRLKHLEHVLQDYTDKSQVPATIKQ